MISQVRQQNHHGCLSNIYTLLMLVIARATDKKLAWQVSYLKTENRLLRSRLPERIIVTGPEKNRLDIDSQPEAYFQADSYASRLICHGRWKFGNCKLCSVHAE